MSPESRSQTRPHVVVTSTKSVGISILLTLFLGPFGLFYATVKGALIVLLAIPMLFILASVVLASTSGGTGSAAPVLLILGMIPLLAATMWIVSMIWSVVAVNAYNRKLLGQAA